ncbi:CHAC2-like protein [Mya arenaria]|uniref:glutathione-specific gamma-glutamylcyclotransferase n=1 Tax=Mya arenaria TaxID=6604 RepID=A0ABY7FIE6_MYAAR|nr:putative glutathione-specific gamma-glutamylcyclotransferase 2 [Mya arenaria]WAR20526.1 CHAC2-like protein [Mya arenaria]
METPHHTNTECIIRIFGYGSLLWKPDFAYVESEVGYIEGFKRRFWQGSDSHRGTKDQNGRVATLIPTQKCNRVWGVVFKVSDPDEQRKAYGGLTKREVKLGGYDVINTVFYPRNADSEPCNVTVFVATRKNRLYLGKASMDTMAMQVHVARGFAGSNTEYVTKTAEYIRKYIPEDDDKHLFDLDRRVRDLAQQTICTNVTDGIEEFYENMPMDDDVE